MNIKLDEKNYITEFAVIGNIDNSIKADIDEKSFGEYPCFYIDTKIGKITLR